MTGDSRLLTEPGTLASFPPGFAWGAATAAYQIEGSAREGGRGPSIWDTFSHTPGATFHGDNGDVACDHYRLWEQDLGVISDLGLTAYRMSVSWARLQPGGVGPLNATAVAHYRTVLEGLHARGVRPFVTLYHWDLPQELEDAGGWPQRDTAQRFAEYAAAVVRELGDLADDWITLNEPWCSAFLGYGAGRHAPGRHDVRDAVAAGHHLNLAHGLALQAIRAARPAARVGVAHILTDLLPSSAREDDVAAARRMDANNNRFFLDPLLRGGYSRDVHQLYDEYGLAEVELPGDAELIRAPIDFLGLNHYHRQFVSADPAVPVLGATSVAAEPASTAFGWSITPPGLLSVLRRVSQEAPGLPIHITENGASFHDYPGPDGHVRDPERIAYLDGYLSAAADAIAEGVRLEGYFAWSLLDNFEWGEGYSQRFGLVYVDYRTQDRIPKESAAWYREVISLHAQMVGQDHPHVEQAETASLTPDRSEGRAVSPE